MRVLGAKKISAVSEELILSGEIDNENGVMYILPVSDSEPNCERLLAVIVFDENL